MNVKYEIKNKIGKNINGSCYWNENNRKQNKIIISQTSDNMNRTIIHETLHAALNTLKQRGQHERLVVNINNNESFVFKLAELIAENLKVEIKGREYDTSSTIL